MKRFLLDTAWKIENRFRNRAFHPRHFEMVVCKTYGWLFLQGALFGIDAGVAAALGFVAACLMNDIAKGEHRYSLKRDAFELLFIVGLVSNGLSAVVLYIWQLSLWGISTSILAHAGCDLLTAAATFAFVSLHMRGTLSGLTRRLGLNVGEQSPTAFGVV